MKRIFDVPIGFSDHSLGGDAAFLSIGIGAVMIEKHLTFDKSRKGYDHGISMDQKEIKILVEKVRLAERTIGKIGISFKELQKEKRKKNLRCIVAKNNIAKGELFTEENITIKRPLAKQRGLEPKYYYSIFNKIANLQLLQATENIEKSNTHFVDWIDNKYNEEGEKNNFLKQHNIPSTVSLDLTDFIEFYDVRKDSIRKKLMSKLGVTLETMVEA